MKTESVVKITSTLKIFKGHPSLVPYLSVFFILLIFFMMGTNFVPVQGIPVELPKANPQTTFAARNLIVTVDKNSSLYFNDELVGDMETLKQKLFDVQSAQAARSAARDNVRERVVIRYDVQAGVATMVELIQIADSLGMDAWLMVNVPEKKGTSFEESER